MVKVLGTLFCGWSMGRTTGKLKFKTFKSHLTNLILLAIPAMAVGAYMIWNGWMVYKSPINQPPFVPDPIILGTCFVRISLGICIVVLVAGLLAVNSRRSVTISPDGVVCITGKREVSILWRDVIATRSQPHQKHFRTLSISNGKDFFRMEAFFFKEFNLVEQVVTKALERQKDSSVEI